MTREDLRRIIEGISDEQLKKILDINSLDIGKAKMGYDELKNQLEAANAKNIAMEDEISVLKAGQCEAEEMKIKIEELQKVIDKKTAEEQEKNTIAEMNRRFETASEGKAFINDFTRVAIFEQFKMALADEKNLGRADIDVYAELVSGKENLFVPDEGVPSIVASTLGFGGSLTEGDVREIMGLPNLV